MADRTVSLIAGTAILCFWLGYLAAKFANGLPIGLNEMDALTVGSVVALLGYARRKPDA